MNPSISDLQQTAIALGSFWAGLCTIAGTAAVFFLAFEGGKRRYEAMVRGTRKADRAKPKFAPNQNENFTLVPARRAANGK